jgi:hypothetical protein
VFGSFNVDASDAPVQHRYAQRTSRVLTLPIARLEVAIATRQHPLRTEPLAQYSSAARSKSNEVIHRCRRWRTPPKHEPFTTLDVPFRTPLATSQGRQIRTDDEVFRSP